MSHRNNHRNKPQTLRLATVDGTLPLHGTLLLIALVLVILITNGGAG